MRARVVAAGFGDYATGLHRTQLQFPPAMRYALMERWNDCTHTFIFGFGEMTLTPADYIAITGLRFDGPVAPLDARYQTATLGAQLVRTLLGVTTQTRYTAQGCAYYELLCTSQNKGDPAVLACLRDFSQVGSYDWATPALAHLYHGLDIWTRDSGESNWQFICPLKVWAYEYRIYPGGPSGDAPAASRRIPRYLAHCHHTFSSSEDPHYWRCFLNDRALSDARLPEVREYTQERKKHQTPAYYRAEAEAEAVALAGPAGALEVDRLRTRLEVEGIPLDFSEDEEDDDGSSSDGFSSDDALPSPPPQAAAGPSRRRR
ncbi:hypothetical protein JCGZ_02439 [Jatropha curcas]|uniref:Aminotransferase-like plant mobile domain-containing protein n=1 Tax=Jatropha curcas TaxID=180498 RepID=A0A067LHY0_JATCU|nr:hypothetical protein JCGZ_02439 [Jatropha curcas]